MRSTKAVMKNGALYGAKTGTLIWTGFSSRQALEQYARHHDVTLPVADNAGQLWDFAGKLVYRIHGVDYETIDDDRIRVVRCTDCGGMGIPLEETNIEADCYLCTSCSQEFGVRLATMES